MVKKERKQTACELQTEVSRVWATSKLLRIFFQPSFLKCLIKQNNLAQSSETLHRAETWP